MNKFDIKQYLEKLYSVSVLDVTTTNFPRKASRLRGTVRPARKNAVVEISPPFQFPPSPLETKLRHPVAAFSRKEN